VVWTTRTRDGNGSQQNSPSNEMIQTYDMGGPMSLVGLGVFFGGLI
jgi:hypothetical protein